MWIINQFCPGVCPALLCVESSTLSPCFLRPSRSILKGPDTTWSHNVQVIGLLQQVVTVRSISHNVGTLRKSSAAGHKYEHGHAKLNNRESSFSLRYEVCKTSIWSETG